MNLAHGIRPIIKRAAARGKVDSLEIARPSPIQPIPFCLADATYSVGRTMFETDRIPKGWAKRLNGMDEIWVPAK